MATAAEIGAQLDRARTQLQRIRREGTEVQQRAIHAAAIVGGQVASAGVCAGLGYLEGRVRRKDGSMLSVGPLSLPAAAAIAAGPIGPVAAMLGAEGVATVASQVASGLTGLAIGTWARGAGTAHYLAKPADKAEPRSKKAVTGDADDAWIAAALED